MDDRYVDDRQIASAVVLAEERDNDEKRRLGDRSIERLDDQIGLN